MRALGFPLAVVGTVLVWFGFAISLGMLGWFPIRQWSGLAGGVLGLALVLWSGFLLNKPLARGFVVPGICLLADAGLIAFVVPKMVNAGSGQDGVTLASLMGAGVLLFFGLALLIGGALAAAFASDRRS